MNAIGAYKKPIRIAMIKVDYARSIRSVQNADTAPVSERYGYRVADPVQIRFARKFVEDIVAICEKRFDEHFVKLGSIEENMWRSPQTPDYSEPAVPYCAAVGLFTDDELKGWFRDALSNVKLEAQPELDRLKTTIMEELKTRAEANGFEVANICRERSGYNTYSAEYRMFVRDPIYVADRVAEESARAKDSKLFRSMFIKLGWTKPTPPPVLKLTALAQSARAALPAPTDIQIPAQIGASVAIEMPQTKPLA